MKHLLLFFAGSLLLLACGSIQRKQQTATTTQSGVNTKDSTIEKNYSLSIFSNLNVQLENQYTEIYIYSTYYLLTGLFT